MLDQLQVRTTTTITSAPVDRAEYERAVADFAECGVAARVESNGLVFVGSYARLHFPTFTLVTSEAYAAGYACGEQQCRESIQADISVSLTDHEFTKRIDQAIPAILSPEDHKKWRAGFLTGWVMQWYQEWSA